jgi:hypothetical protein
MLNRIIKVLALTAALLLSTAAFCQESGGGTISVTPSPSADGTRIVFAADFSNPASQLQLWIANMNGSGLHSLSASSYAKINEEPSWSTTDVIAFSSNDGTYSNIWTVAPDGSRLVQLTSGHLNNRMPAWSPDGSKIAFVSDRNGSNDIWIMNVDGTAQTRLTTLTGEENHPGFSPDGLSIVFSETQNDTASLMLVNTDGSGLRNLTSGQYKDWNPSWGAAGIVFSSNRDVASEHWKPWIIQANGTGLQKFGDILATDPVWLSNGSILFSDETSGIGALSAISLFNPLSGVKHVVVNQAGYLAAISIRPFHEPYRINLKSRGKLRVAILSSPTFNALDQVVVSSLTFGHSGMENSLYKCYPKGKDVNKDHLADLVCRFYISKSGFLAGDTKAYVRFNDMNGSLYQGTVLINIISQDPDDEQDDNADSN